MPWHATNQAIDQSNMGRTHDSHGSGPCMYLEAKSTHHENVVPDRSSRSLLRSGLSWRVARDPRTPLRLKLLLAGALVLIVSPINWIPNFIPVLGQIEDLALLALALNVFLKAVLHRHPGGARGGTRLRLIAALRRPWSVVRVVV